MNTNSQSGGGIASVFFAILFLASLALNVAFLTGCDTLDDLSGGKSSGRTHQTGTTTNPPSSETDYLREIALSLGLSPSSDKTPSDIVCDIKQKMQKYHGEVFSKESFDEYKTVFPSMKDAETFEQYHRFIRNVAGKRILVLDN